MPEIPKRFVKRAAANIVAHGDTDVFPFPFENILIRRNQDDFVDLICSLSETFKAGLSETPPQFESTLAPSGYSGYRWVTQICPFWNCYLLAAVLRHAEQIEAARIPVEFGCVHSYRLNANEESEDLFRPEYSWRSFMLASLEAAEKSRFVVLTDISEFYRRIYHHRVENAMEQICSTNIPDKIIDLLKIFSRGSSYGLPIGGPAARIISELVLNQVDHLLRSKGIIFCRFADDFHIFTDSEEGAYKSLQTLSEMLIVNQGLTLQKSKTRIMPSTEFISTFPAHLIPGATPSTDRERLFHVSLSYDPYSPTAASDYEALRESLGSIDFLSLLDDELAKSQVHGPTVSKLLTRPSYT